MFQDIDCLRLFNLDQRGAVLWKARVESRRWSVFLLYSSFSSARLLSVFVYLLTIVVWFVLAFISQSIVYSNPRLVRLFHFSLLTVRFFLLDTARHCSWVLGKAIVQRPRFFDVRKDIEKRIKINPSNKNVNIIDLYLVKMTYYKCLTWFFDFDFRGPIRRKTRQVFAPRRLDTRGCV